jgi:rhodanese-related sulfurtransferase
MKTIDVTELSKLLQSDADMQLIDVREPDEHEEFNIGGTLIPLSTVTKNIELFEKEKPVVVYCRRGVRSQIAIQRLQQKYPFQNLINLTGGTEAWKKEFIK